MHKKVSKMVLFLFGIALCWIIFGRAHIEASVKLVRVESINARFPST